MQAAKVLNDKMQLVSMQKKPDDHHIGAGGEHEISTACLDVVLAAESADTYIVMEFDPTSQAKPQEATRICEDRRTLVRPLRVRRRRRHKPPCREVVPPPAGSIFGNVYRCTDQGSRDGVPRRQPT